MTDTRKPHESTAPAASVDWEDRASGPWHRGLVWLEGVTLRVERGVRWIVRRPEVNPLYHTGTITIFLLVLIFASGLYLTMFFQFGFEASYRAVDALESNFVGRFMRALHRYASIAAIVTAAIHGWRTFVMRRFAGARRMPWATGVSMVAVLWVVGVTGYWLIWDERAQVFNDALTRAISGTSLGLDFLIDFVLTDAAGSGWPFLLILITIHVGLSLVVGGLLWYHLKRLTRRHWMPPPVWLWIVGGTTVIVSVAIPVGMLPPVDRHLVPGTVPLDPFFLFLLPGTLSWPPAVLWAGATVLLGLVVFLPWVLRATALPPIVVSEDRCIGCTLCVADCPYRALEMVIRDDEGDHPQLAVVHGSLCVSCGICIGTCPTNALTLGTSPAEPLWEAATTTGEKAITFVCERHMLHGAAHLNADSAVIPLPCVGMAHPELAAQAIDAGAASVTFVGCAADDCANLEGNVWLQDRLDRTRRPKLKRRHLDKPIVTAWLPPDATGEAAHAAALPPNEAYPATIRDQEAGADTRRLIAPAVFVLVAGVLTVVLSMLPFDPGGNDQARIEIALDHRDGTPLTIGPDDPLPADAIPARLILDVDGATVLDETYPFVTADGGDTSLAFERVPITPGTHAVTLVLDDGAEIVVVFEDTVALDPGQTLTIDILDAQVVAMADAGRSLYFETTIGSNAGCRICHSLDPDVTLVGPTFGGVATRAASRVPDLTAEEYLRQSILDPDAFVVDGFSAGQMIPTYLEILSEEDVDNLVAFLLTLEEE